jgi:o-succinylbenzoate---CoA ligase
MSLQFQIKDFLKKNSYSDIFIYTDQHSYSYQETLDKAAEYKNYISRLNLKGKQAAVLLSNSPEFIFLLPALWDLKITPVLINTRLTFEEIKDLVSYSECSYLFTTESFNYEFSIPVCCLPLHSDSPEEIKRKINYDETAVVIFTSGSSGRPKGVQLGFGTLFKAAEIQNKFLKQEPGDKWLASLPFYHIGGFSIITRSLSGRSSIIISDSLNTESLVNSIKNFKPEFMSLVGMQLKKMLDIKFTPGEQVKNILIGGGFTDEDIILDALDRGWKISKTYGSTETSAFIAAISGEELKKYPSSAGKELIPQSVFITDGVRNIVNALKEGEISLKNVPLMSGYIKDKEIIGRKFHNGYFLTGDIGYLNEEGFLFIQMRRTDLIVSGGENLDPKEVEKVLLEIRGINDAYVFPLPDKKWGQTAAAVLCGRVRYSPEELKKLLSGRLAGYKVPKSFFYLDEIPRSELGKVQLNELKRLIGIEF